MISSEHKNRGRVFKHVSKKEHDCFNGLLSPIDIIAEKKILELLRRESIFFEDFNKVRKLAMNVTHYDYRWLNFK